MPTMLELEASRLFPTAGGDRDANVRLREQTLHEAFRTRDLADAAGLAAR